MGHIRTAVTFLGRGGERRTLTMLVDTGATYTWVPRKLLQTLGVQPQRRMSFRIGNGRVIHRWIGEVVVDIRGIRASTTVVFALERDATVLGVYALEGVGLEVDPAQHALRPMEALLLAAA